MAAAAIICPVLIAGVYASGVAWAITRLGSELCGGRLSVAASIKGNQDLGWTRGGVVEPFEKRGGTIESPHPCDQASGSVDTRSSRSSAGAGWVRFTGPLTRRSAETSAIKVLPREVANRPERIERSGA